MTSSTEYIPEHSLEFVHEHVLHPHSHVQTIKREVLTVVRNVTAAMYPVLEPLFDRLAQAIYRSPDIVVLGFFLVVLFVAVQIMSWVRRMLAFWTRVAVRLVFWAAVVATLSFVYQRGVEESVRDAVVFGGKLLGFAASVRNIWLQEYQKYQAQANMHRHPPGARYGYGNSRGQ